MVVFCKSIEDRNKWIYHLALENFSEFQKSMFKRTLLKLDSNNILSKLFSLETCDRYGFLMRFLW